MRARRISFSAPRRSSPRVGRPRPRRTVIFFLVSTVLSLSSELIGTGTGWAFGNYEYTAFLGYKILDRVPFSIPLSWFSMGLVSYLLGQSPRGQAGRAANILVLALGVWLLTAWDLVLDPAMADPSLRVQFWTWHETGPYFGMPIQNLVGWSVTGLLYMGLSRLLWGSDIDVGRIAVRRGFHSPCTWRISASPWR